jgi:hypothetical protein
LQQGKAQEECTAMYFPYFSFDVFANFHTLIIHKITSQTNPKKAYTRKTICAMTAPIITMPTPIQTEIGINKKIFVLYGISNVIITPIAIGNIMTIV